MIQTALRRELGKDITCITVAHRLNSVMQADKIVRLLFNFYSAFGRRLHSTYSPMIILDGP